MSNKKHTNNRSGNRSGCIIVDETTMEDEQFFNRKVHIQKYKEEIEAHSRNSNVIACIYLTCSIIGIISQTTVSFMLGSKSIADVRDTFTFTAFILNMAGTIIMSVVNTLKLETKIAQHEHTVNQYENLMIDMEKNISKELIIEKEKTINSNAPRLCF